MIKIFFYLSVFFFSSPLLLAQDISSLSDQLKLIDGILAIKAHATSGEDSFFQMSEKVTKKTVFWEVFREKGELRRNYALSNLPNGIYHFQFALDGKAISGEIFNKSEGPTLKVYHSTEYKRPYFNVKVEKDTLQIDGFFAQDSEVQISIKNEDEFEDLYNASIELKNGKLKTQYILDTFGKGNYVIRAKLKDRTFVRNFILK
ncbi:hypothetical protein [Flammeovirga aprica]|uniref:T9SS type A sorting domain-containing protein n=1 Tax=Flammeovirga aprica JL-4 TaxID=694437 RepID=A0A7X9RQY3_9BACT|nr:hypothetical protein [Flammeovirga aprica]NME67248.1 hypothetical protein [Flammeovirga aprica JL-4]